MLLAAVGDNCESAIAAAVYHARTLILSSTHKGPPQELPALRNDIRPEWMQDWYDGLGYCKHSLLLSD